MNFSTTFKAIVGIIVTLMTLAGGIITVEDRYAKADDVKDMNIQLETKVVAVLDKYKADMKQDRLEQRYLNLVDQASQLKMMIRKSPKDTDLKEDYDNVNKEKEQLKKQLEMNRNLLK